MSSVMVRWRRLDIRPTLRIVTGFTGDSPRRPLADLARFPAFMARQTKTNEAPPIARPICTAEITIKNRKPLATDLANFTAALDGAGATDAFMNASSPGVISAFLPNEYYPSEDAYLEALCNVMREQYEAIVEAGFILQVDCPDVAMARHT